MVRPLHHVSRKLLDKLATRRFRVEIESQAQENEFVIPI